MSNVTPLNAWDGMCAAHWDNLHYGTVWTWTAGTAPNRRFIVSWENFTDSSSANNEDRYHFQARFFESSHKIQFAYKADTSPSTWVHNRYNCGLVAYGSDPRWTAATTDNTVQAGHPATDYEFTPRSTTHTGRLLYDRPVPTASGLPSTATTDVPMARVCVEFRRSDGLPMGAAYVADDGSYQVSGPVMVGLDTGELWLTTMNPGCLVRNTAQTGPVTVRIATGVSLTTSGDFGTTRISEAYDPPATIRAPAAVAAAISRVHGWAAARTTDPLPQVLVDYDPSSSAPTSYSPGSTPTLRVAGAAAPNPDVWDDPVVMRAYARHVLACVSAPAPHDDRFDATTDPQSAFATAFGCFSYSAVTGGSSFVDSIDGSTATSIDLESPSPASAKSASSAAWVSPALHDLTDPANEAWDLIDESGADLAFATVDALAAAPTVADFYREWGVRRDALALSRNFIHHGIVPDDADEPNDSSDQATALQLGYGRKGATLQIHNEDWYEVTASAPVADLLVEMGYRGVPSQPVVLLEAYDDAGALLASKTEASGAGPIVLALGPRPAGVYRARVRHVSGDAVPSYSVQLSERMTFGSRPLKDWTVGRPYVDDLPLFGGVRPYEVSMQPPAAAVPGLGINATNLQVVGTPTVVGTHSFTLAVQDGGDPSHSAAGGRVVVIHPPLSLPMASHMGVPADRPVDFALPRTGGTPPYVFAIDAGAPPAGLSFDATAFLLTGSAATPGSAKATFSGVDAAGSMATADAVVVACAPFVKKGAPVDLAAGESACGFYVDAVRGAALSFSASTAKGSPKRVLQASIVDADGRTVPGATTRDGVGKASGKAVAPASGRYFFLNASADGAASRILGAVANRPATKGKASVKPLAPGETFDVQVGALAGASISLTAKPDRKSGLSLFVAAVLDPDGNALPHESLVTMSKGAVTLRAPLAQSGTWIVRVRAVGSSPGSAAWTLKLKQPKGGSYSAD